jgi:hypothetical protein
MPENLIVAKLTRKLPSCVISSSPEPGAGFCREPNGFVPRPHAFRKILFNSILPSDLFLKVSQIKACVSFVSGRLVLHGSPTSFYLILVQKSNCRKSLKLSSLSLSRGTFRCSESLILTPFLVLVILYEG